MPTWFIVAIGFIGATGIVIGMFVAINVISAAIGTGDERLSQFLKDWGSTEITKSTAATVSPRFTKKPKPATPPPKAPGEKPVAGEAVTAAEGEGGAAEAAGGAQLTAAGNDESLTTISKVWIAPGCIVCDACVETAPEVFKIDGDTCIILPDAPLEQVQEIKDAAAGCPVDVIKYT